MDAATIMVLVLCAGVAALLTWFEINSRRNDAREKQRSTPDPSGLEPLQTEGQIKEGQIKVESNTRNKKAA
ncbi:MAG TPA: hypothetical protein VE377_00145 [Candidatus Dormibacteraeota bacterium]|nr:hypothetical protein [Candidatus Dormibacteraeota bacterium]